MDIEIILFAIIAFVAVRFVIRFLMPIMKITKTAHNHMNEMRQKMNDLEHHQQQTSKKVEGDYIDYEEVK